MQTYQIEKQCEHCQRYFAQGFDELFCSSSCAAYQQDQVTINQLFEKHFD